MLISKQTTAFGASNNRPAFSKSGFVYPPSVQGDLFNYLKPEQQETLKPILRIVKRPYQTKLCVALLDYLEGNGNQHIGNSMLDSMQQTIIEACELHPLTSREPVQIGQVIRKLLPTFPSFNH